jgi:hypothetical protein
VEVVDLVCFHVCTVTCLLIARIAEQEISVARQWLCKQDSMVADPCDCTNRYVNTAIEELLKTEFSCVFHTDAMGF